MPFTKSGSKAGVPLQVSGVPLTSGASWGPRGMIVVGQKSSRLLRFSAEDGTAKAITVPSPETGEQGHTLPQVLPDGENVVFTVETNDQPKVAVASIETGQHRILFDGSNARYLPTGHLVYTQASTLFAMRFDLTRLGTSDDPMPVVDGILDDSYGSIAAVGWKLSRKPRATISTPDFLPTESRSPPLGKRKTETFGSSISNDAAPCVSRSREPNTCPRGRRTENGSRTTRTMPEGFRLHGRGDGAASD